MQEVIAAATAGAAAHGAAVVHALTLRVGAMSGADADALAFAFEAVAAGTPVAGAELRIEAVPVICHCPACGRDFSPPGAVFACPACATVSRDVRQGTELELATLEVS